MLLAFGLTVGFAAIIAANSGPEFPLTVGITQAFINFGLMVIMVMAALAVTTEYRFGTIRATFLAVPKRTSALVAKTTVVALLAGGVGEAIAFAAWGVAKLVKPNVDIAIDTAGEWRNVAGAGLVFLLAAVLAVAVGMLVRQTAGAVAILLVWPLLVESLVGLIPKIGDDIQRWMPFQNADHFLTAGNAAAPAGQGGPVINFPFGAWGSLVYFAAIAFGLLVIALVVAKKRDA